MDKTEAIEVFVLSKTSIQMIEASLERIHVDKLVLPDKQNDLYNDFNFGFRVNELDENEIEAFLKTTIHSYKEDRTPVLKFEVTYRGRFVAITDIDSEEFRKFVEVQTVPQLLPYARAFISSMTVQMGLEPITLPTMDIIQSLVQNASAEEDDEYDEDH